MQDRIGIVGAGVGGLAAAIRLVAAGARVTVFEAAGAPGGKMRSLPSAAGPVAAGPTVLTMRHVFDDLFAAAGTMLDDHVRLIPEPVLARHFWPDGSTLDLFTDAARNVAAVDAFAGPRIADQFRRFQDRARALYETFEAPVILARRPRLAAVAAAALRRPSLLPALRPDRSLLAQLRRAIDDPRLAQLVARYATYVGGAPDRSPALLQLIWQAEMGGVWRVAGGMAALAGAMADLLERLGGEMRLATPVDRIETSGGRAVAIVTRDGRRVACDAVVFNGDPRALRTGRLGPDLRSAVPARATGPRSLSAEVWAFAATPRGRDLHHHNVFFGADPGTEFGPISRGAAPVDPTVYVCAQDRGTGTTPPALERFETIVNAAPLPKNGKAQPCHRETMDLLTCRGLSFTPVPDPATARATPATFAALFPDSLGALYGRSPHGTMAAFARPTAATAVPGLYLAGGGAHPGAGVPMAALSGRHAAEAILMGRTSTSMSRPTAMPGGMSTGSPTMAGAPFRSSGS